MAAAPTRQRVGALFTVTKELPAGDVFSPMLQECYGKITKFPSDGAGFLEAVALRRGIISRGGEADRERAAKAFINDYRKGYLGKIPLEKAGLRESRR